MRKYARQLRHLGFDGLLHLQGVGARQLEDADAGRRLAVEREDLAVGLSTQLDPSDIAQARHLAIGPGLDDDIFELADVVEAAEHINRVLEIDARRRRRHSHLTGGNPLALLLQRLHDFLGIEAACFQLVRIEPDAHRILAGAEHEDVADAGQPRQFVLEVYRGVVGEIEAVVAPVRGSQGDEQQDRRRKLLHRNALCLYRVRQRRQRTGHAV